MLSVFNDSLKLQMKFVIAFIALFAVAHASTIILPAATTTLVRSPAHDSAIVQSERLGGSFAYSTLEGHAYKAITPVVQNVSQYIVKCLIRMYNFCI